MTIKGLILEWLVPLASVFFAGWQARSARRSADTAENEAKTAKEASRTSAAAAERADALMRSQLRPHLAIRRHAAGGMYFEITNDGRGDARNISFSWGYHREVYKKLVTVAQTHGTYGKLSQEFGTNVLTAGATIVFPSDEEYLRREGLNLLYGSLDGRCFLTCVILDRLPVDCFTYNEYDFSDPLPMTRR